MIPSAAGNENFAAVAIVANAGTYAAGYLWHCENQQKKAIMRRNRGQ